MGSVLNINNLTDEEKKAMGIPTSFEKGPEPGSPLSPNEMGMLLGGSGSGEIIDPETSERRPLNVNDVGSDTTPNLMQMLDLDEPDIKREQQDQVFDGSTYLPQPKDGYTSNGSPFVWDMQPTEEKKRTDEANSKLYQEQGHALIPGLENGPRLQDSVDEQGNKETQFVPPAELSDPLSRSVIGAGLETAKAAAKLPAMAAEALDGRNWANFLTQNLPLSSQLKEELKIAKPDAVAYIDSNFPTFPAGSPLEKMFQEIAPIVFGGLKGEQVAKETIEKLPAAQRLIAENARDFLNAFGDKSKVDTVNAQQKTEAFLKSMIAEYGGANVGATLAAPDDSQAFTGSTFLDNTAASTFFRALGLSYKGIKNFAGASVGSSKTFPMTERGMAANYFKSVDPDVVDVAPEELYKRMASFSKAISDNADVANNTFGPITQGPASALWQGARQYVEESYGFLRNSMGPKYEEWANNKAAQVADAAQAMKRDHLHSPIVQTADANVLDKANTAISNKAEEISPYGKTKDGLEAFAEPTLQQYNRIRADIAAGENGVAEATQRLNKVGDGNAFLDAIDKNHAGNAFDNDIAHITDKRAKAIAARDKWQKSHDNYTDKFNNLPSNTKFNVRELVDKLEHFGNQDDIGKLFNLEGGAPTQKFGKLEGQLDADGNPQRLNVEDNLAGKDMKWLVTKARPYFTQQLEAAKNAARNAKTPVNLEEYTNLIKWIDNQADQYPGAKEAKQAYADHQNKWGQIEETQRLNSVAKDADNAVQARDDEAYKQFYNFQDKVLKDPDGSGVMLSNWMKSFDAGNKETSSFVMNELVSALAGAKPQDADVLLGIIKPQMTKFHDVDPEAYNLINNAVKEVEQAKTGLKGADDQMIAINKVAKEQRAKLADTAASKFLNQFEGQAPEFAGEQAVTRAERMFGDATQTKKLFTEARAQDNPLITEGLEGQFLRYMRDNIFTSKAISATGSGNAVKEASLTKLNNILDGSDQKWKETFDIVFANKPQFREDFDLLLSTLRDDVNVRSNKPNSFGSDTMTNLAGKTAREKAAGLVTTILFGRLNRTAATVGAFAKAINTAIGAGEEEAITSILPTLLTDSHRLTDILDQVVKNPDPAEVKHIVDKLVGNSGSVTNTTKGFIFSQTPEKKKEDDTEKAFTEPTKTDKVSDTGGRLHVAMDETSRQKAEDLLTTWAQGNASAKETQKMLRDMGYKANLRERLGNDVELTPLGEGPIIRVII